MIRHLACMMDGNRRWAHERGLHSYKGHREGVEAVKRIVSFCIEKGIPYLSLYTFSLENFRRSEEEKSYLFSLMAEMFEQSADEFIKHGIRVRFIGERALFPKQIAAICTKLEEQTAHLTALNLNFLFCYGAQQEIVSGVKNIVYKILNGTLTVDQISQEQFKQSLWTGDIPEPDVIIRPGNVKRLSNFLLYQGAYSELFFLDCMWPELTTQHLEDVVTSYEQRERRFGA